MHDFNATQLVTAVVKATSEGDGVINSSRLTPQILGPGDSPVKHPMVSAYMIIVAVVILFTLLIWRGGHQSLMMARAERLAPKDSDSTHKTASLWLRLFRFAWNGIQTIYTSFLGIFTKTFWDDLWTHMRKLFSPLSSCGVCLNAYSCGLICNPDMDGDDTLPVAEKGNVVVVQSPMTMSKRSDLQRPPPTIVFEERV